MRDFLAIMAALALAAYLFAFISAWRAVTVNQPKWTGWEQFLYCLLPGSFMLLARTAWWFIRWVSGQRGKHDVTGKASRGVKAAKAKVKGKGRRRRGKAPAPETDPEVAAELDELAKAKGDRPGRGRRKSRGTPLAEVPAGLPPAAASSSGKQDPRLTPAMRACLEELGGFESTHYGKNVEWLQAGILFQMALGASWRRHAEHAMTEVGLHPMYVASVLDYANEHVLMVSRLGGVLHRLQLGYEQIVTDVETGKFRVPRNASGWLRRSA